MKKAWLPYRDCGLPQALAAYDLAVTQYIAESADPAARQVVDEAEAERLLECAEPARRCSECASPMPVFSCVVFCSSVTTPSPLLPSLVSGFLASACMALPVLAEAVRCSMTGVLEAA